MVDRERLNIPHFCQLKQLREFANLLQLTPIPEHWIRNIIKVFYEYTCT